MSSKATHPKAPPTRPSSAAKASGKGKAKVSRTPAQANSPGKPAPQQTAAVAASARPPRIVEGRGPVVQAVPAAPTRVSKQAQLIASLRAAPGVTIGQMMALTGWQAHTVRGTISGVLRKKLGLNVSCASAPDGGERRYRIVDSAAQA